MGYDIYGDQLERGHCEVHPYVHEEYPCSVCIAEKKQVDKPNKNDKEIQALNDKIALYESWMKRTEIGKNTIWDLICREYPYLKED